MNAHHLWLLKAAKDVPDRETSSGWLQRIEAALRVAESLGILRASQT